jgi:hypothetical protein
MTKRQKQYKLPIFKIAIILIAMAYLILFIDRTNRVSQLTKPQPNPLLDFKTAIYNAMENGKCIGYLKYYSKTNFSSDVGRMSGEYHAKYSADTNNLSTIGINLHPPAALGMNQEGYDCEDFVLAVYCMASLYPNVTCNLYTSYREDRPGHVGAICDEQIGDMTINVVV